ncbi:MAG: efflux transporter outer membrane subunit [Gammaproteobacteria bacterium]|nr:efflux transporter outer membrane subunit [Gammaproteobacteria bacterium]
MPYWILFFMVGTLVACQVPKLPAPADLSSPLQLRAYADKIVNPQQIDHDQLHWWRHFGDAELNDLQTLLSKHSPNLEILAAQIRAATALVASTKANPYPVVNLSTFSSISSNANTEALVRNFQPSIPISWQVDVWGQNDKKVQLNQSEVSALQADFTSAKLAAQSDLVQLYFNLRALDYQTYLQKKLWLAYQQAEAAVLAKHRLGTASSLDVVVLQKQTQTLATHILDLQTARAQTEHAMVALVGKTPAELSIPAWHEDKAMQSISPLPPLPQEIQADILTRRPDLQAAQWRVQEAHLQLGIVRDTFFPTVNFSLALGYRSNQLANLVNASNTFWSLGANSLTTLFDSQARQANWQIAYANWEKSIAFYRLLVISSYQALEDNLVSYQNLSLEIPSSQRALEASEKYLNLIQQQYHLGYLDVFALTTAKTQYANDQLRHYTVLNRLRLTASQLLAQGLMLPIP